MVRLIDLLELPGAGKVVSTTLWVVRTPYRLLKGAVSKAFSRPASTSLPEQQVLDDALTAWLDQLRSEALRRSGQHGLWEHIAQGFDGSGGVTPPLQVQAREQFQQGVRSFQAGLADEIDRTARAIYEELEKSPARLTALRGSKLALDIVAIGGTLVAGGLNWHDVILVPASASVAQMLIEWLGSTYVDTQRELTRNRQQALVSQCVANPLAEWLTRWPATGGSAYERLQLALSRVPRVIHQLDDAVKRKNRPEEGTI